MASSFSYEVQRQMIEKAIARFPATFRLRGRPNDTFRISKQSSYVNDDDIVMLYTECFLPDNGGGMWHSYAKGTAAELTMNLL